ncbi:MAG: hypothetical protein UHG68_10895 [Clostridia bacterium]|nr:hypothetical protein [Clostridia bacterium]
MKKIISVILTLVMCIAVCLSISSCSSSGEAHMGFKIISTDINDFNLEVPSEWTVASQNGYVSAVANGTSGDKSNISVMSSQLNGQFDTPEQYFESLLESYGEIYDNINVTSRDIDTELGTEKAKKYVFSADVMGESYKFMQVLCVYGQRIYVFTYTSTEEFYETHETEVEFILDYFSFKV